MTASRTTGIHHGQPSGPIEREGHGHRKDELGEQNRHFGGGEGAELGRGVGGAALQRGDAHGKADLAVDEGKTEREAIRCIKRYLARRIWRLLEHPPNRT